MVEGWSLFCEIILQLAETKGNASVVLLAIGAVGSVAAALGNRSWQECVGAAALSLLLTAVVLLAC